jgi:hypothetical protein
MFSSCSPIAALVDGVNMRLGQAIGLAQPLRQCDAADLRRSRW